VNSKLLQAKPKFLRGLTNPIHVVDWMQENSSVPSFSFVGRSNVGKSSLINKLYGQKTAKTSKTPGRTREINVFEATFYIEIENEKTPMTGLLYDLPGYGHANVSKEMAKSWNQLMAIFFEILAGNAVLFNIQDARHPFEKADLKFLNFITEYPTKAHLLLNKYDKLKKQADRSSLAKLLKANKEITDNFQTVNKVSADNGTGLEVVDQIVAEHLKSYC
jgi:GTP-binding protein